MIPDISSRTPKNKLYWRPDWTCFGNPDNDHNKDHKDKQTKQAGSRVAKRIGIARDIRQLIFHCVHLPQRERRAQCQSLLPTCASGTRHSEAPSKHVFLVYTENLPYASEPIVLYFMLNVEYTPCQLWSRVTMTGANRTGALP